MKNQEDVNKLIGDRIRAARLEAGMSQGDLATELGYESATAVSLIETGQRALRAENVTKLCQIFPKSADYFTGKEEGDALPPVSLKFALRSQKLNESGVKKVLDFIEFIKNTDASSGAPGRRKG